MQRTLGVSSGGLGSLLERIENGKISGKQSAERGGKRKGGGGRRGKRWEGEREKREGLSQGPPQ